MSDRDLLVSIQTQLNDYLSAVTPPPPPNPQPPQPPSIPPTGGTDLSDKVQRAPVRFAEGQPQRFFFYTAGGYAGITVFPLAGTTAKTGHWIVAGSSEQSFTPSGSDFRFKPVDGYCSPGVVSVDVWMTGIKGVGDFGLQADGAVGP
jgi:hypothetical protein